MHRNGQLPAYEWAFDDVNPPVHAEATLALCFPKSVFFGNEHVGELNLADISVLPSIVERVTALQAPPFPLGSILRIATSSVD